jgi:hypothetical protein
MVMIEIAAVSADSTAACPGRRARIVARNEAEGRPARRKSLKMPPACDLLTCDP